MPKKKIIPTTIKEELEKHNTTLKALEQELDKKIRLKEIITGRSWNEFGNSYLEVYKFLYGDNPKNRSICKNCQYYIPSKKNDKRIGSEFCRIMDWGGAGSGVFGGWCLMSLLSKDEKEE
jgi:hypothetical protein